jgi:mRNA-degrading endonuclease RelE of RelBE toxin-antitoxin system
MSWLKRLDDESINDTLSDMTWTVKTHKRTEKQIKKLPQRIQDILTRLMLELESSGAVRGTWLNYGKLTETRHHCHLKAGKPTYVAVWEERKNEIRLIEVIYVGTHEKAPY